MHSTVQTFASNPRLTFWSIEDERMSSKCVKGWLGAPNPAARNSSAMQLVAGGTGDDAGHLIARRFGGPDDECNLSRQNWRQNRGGGTFYNLETHWAAALDRGAEVWVSVEEKTMNGASRSMYRRVEWTVTQPGQRPESGSLIFANTSSVRLRKKSGDDPELTRGLRS